MRLTKTDSGQAAFKERSPLFSTKQRATFILVDGKKTVDEILASTVGMGVTHADLEYMVSQGFLTVVGDPAAAAVSSAPSSAPAPLSVPPPDAALPSGRTEQQRYQDAKPIATKLTAGLGLRGFMLNLSVESAAGYEDLLKLLPKIQDAVGTKACRELEQALKG
jgi:hypothetical protein